MATGNDVDIELFGMNLVMGNAFSQMLNNRLEQDDEGQGAGQAFEKETNKTIAATMAQAVTGFGL
jgi:hypothetical protein